VTLAFSDRASQNSNSIVTSKGVCAVSLFACKRPPLVRHSKQRSAENENCDFCFATANLVAIEGVSVFFDHASVWQQQKVASIVGV
jgi:hypothetical protein